MVSGARTDQTYAGAPLPLGFRAAGTYAGLKPEGRGLDLGLLLADAACTAHAVYTKNALLGAHIPVCRDHLARSGNQVRAVLCNSGNANCATGDLGSEDARTLCRAVASELDCPEEQVLVISTGVIGARLPMSPIIAAIPGLCSTASPSGAVDFARAIMTTDTHPKLRTKSIGPSRVTGFAKGAGMIHPDMATMLGFLLADVSIAGDPAALLRQTVDRSFHRISVDGDTSPNDTVLLWSSQQSPPLTDFESALTELSTELCREIAGDGEGATRLVTVEVRGAASEQDAAHVGRLIATSPLCKTAITGHDPNWGRILSVAGRAHTAIDIARARVWIGDTVLYEDGGPHPEREADAYTHLSTQREIRIGVDLAVGNGRADVWTCDLTSEYVRINADYRT